MWFILFCFLLSVKSEYVSVKTDIGKIIGVKHEGYSAFTGIPYCKVNHRDPFGYCLNVANFKEPFQAYNNSNITCYQMKDSQFSGTEQCLTMNIYVPETQMLRLPVLVWFHGESFWYGDANEYSSSYFVKQQIIFVAVNFRLGSYGFLCAKDYNLPGNRGMKDQVQALRWIRSNIESFNGDPVTVTIAGSGYGGGYVNLHLYGRFSETLFDKAIIHSGSIFTNNFFVPADSRIILELGRYFGRRINRYTVNEEVMPLLNGKPFNKLFSATKLKTRYLGICKEPKIGNGQSNIVLKSPFFLDARDQIIHSKVLIGYNSMEMLGMFAENNTDAYYDNAGDIIYNILAKSFRLKSSQLQELTDVIMDFYFGGKGYGPDSITNLADAMSDFYVNNGVERAITKLVNAGATVYKYLFTYNGASKYLSINESGASQGEELKFLLDWRFPISGEEQEAIRTEMVTMWANFIKFGNPTPDDQPVAWTPLHGHTRPYLNIGSSLKMMDNSFVRRSSFWDLFWRIYASYSIVY